jgi:hypothetical protein
MSDDLAAYRAEIRAVEDDWFNQQAYGEDGRIGGSSLWNNNLALLLKIDRKHGIASDDPRVYSISAYQAEVRRIDAEWDVLVQKNPHWERAKRGGPAYQEWFLSHTRFQMLMADCNARHFRQMAQGNMQVDTIPKLWGYIKLHLIAVAETLSNQSPQYERTRIWNETVQLAYSAMHDLKLDWAPAPPYHEFRESQARDEMKRIVNRLEREDAERSRAMQTLSVATSEPTASKTRQNKHHKRRRRRLRLRPTAPAAPSVILAGRSEPPIVRGNHKSRPLTKAQYEVVQSLLSVGDAGLTKDQLAEKSGHGDARKVLKRLADSDPDWKAVIKFPGRTGGGYRIA